MMQGGSGECFDQVRSHNAASLRSYTPRSPPRLDLLDLSDDVNVNGKHNEMSFSTIVGNPKATRGAVETAGYVGLTV